MSTSTKKPRVPIYARQQDILGLAQRVLETAGDHVGDSAVTAKMDLISDARDAANTALNQAIAQRQSAELKTADARQAFDELRLHLRQLRDIGFQKYSYDYQELSLLGFDVLGPQSGGGEGGAGDPGPGGGGEGEGT